MIKNKKIIVVMPAYNAEQTLKQTYSEIPFGIVDDIILVDDKSKDNTVKKAKELGIKHVFSHEINKGYGGNQKTCYNQALELNADIIIMLHPDYQYTPLLIESMAYLIANGVYKVVLGSRILGKGALKGGMPKYKYLFNRILTFFQNLLMNQKLSEYHTGYRAFDAEVLRKINFQKRDSYFCFFLYLYTRIFSVFKFEFSCNSLYSNTFTFYICTLCYIYLQIFFRQNWQHSTVYCYCGEFLL